MTREEVIEVLEKLLACIMFEDDIKPTNEIKEALRFAIRSLRADELIAEKIAKLEGREYGKE